MDEIIKSINAQHRFRDPLYGFIYLTDDELKIVDTPIFQRLRRVHQLALTKYVYPTAEHSRFVHSLGVVHSATAMLAGIRANKRTKLSDADWSHRAKLVRFAALLHDIGHLPFSHAAERQWLKNLSHEALSQSIITNYAPIKDAIENSEVQPESVAAILSKKHKARHRLMHEIVSGQLDADRADYLLRDSYCCGVKYGEYDFNRYTRIFSTVEGNGGFRLAVEEKDMYVAEAFLIARYHYNLQVPYHRTRNAYDCVLRKFLSNLDLPPFFEIEGGRFKYVDLERFVQLDDYWLFQIIKDCAHKNDKWAKMLLRDGHLKTLLDTTSSASGGTSQFKSTIDMLVSAGFTEGESFFVLNKEIDVLKKADISAPESESETNTILVLCDGYSDEYAVDICEHSWIFQHLRDNPPRVLRVYVDPARHDEAKRILRNNVALPQGVPHEH